MDDSKLSNKRPATSLEQIKNDINDCKTHIEALLEKLGPNEEQFMNNVIDWPTLLNLYAIISSDMIKISKVLRDQNSNNLKNCVFVPKTFTEDVDINLQQLTQNRMSVFNHDLIPHILRTKLPPELEERENNLIKASRDFEQIKNYEKNITQFKKAINEVLHDIETRRKEIETTRQATSATTYSTQETHNLAMTIMYGDKTARGGRPMQPVYPGQMGGIVR